MIVSNKNFFYQKFCKYQLPWVIAKADLIKKSQFYILIRKIITLLICFQFKNLEKNLKVKGKVEGKKEWYDELKEKQRASIKQEVDSLKTGRIIQDCYKIERGSKEN